MKPPTSDRMIARGLAHMITTGKPSPAAFAEIALATQGKAFIETAAAQTPEQAIKIFQDDPEAWPLLQGIQPELQIFMTGFLEACRKLIETPSPQTTPTPQ